MPLLVLLTAYTIAVVGMTLIPGTDAQGRIWYLDFFHAFYFISYTATTIGFGEIPYAFSDAQRMWVTFSIYVTVIAWAYAIGMLLTLLQEEGLRRTLIKHRFRRMVKQIHEPFYLVCGYGDSGEALVSALEEHWLRAVVIEVRQERIDNLMMTNYPAYVPKLCADASKVEHLLLGGLTNPHCVGIIALTNNNLANLYIALTARLLNPLVTVIARVDSQEIKASLVSFETDYIINPFETFALELHTVLSSPHLYLLYHCLTGKRNIKSCKPLNPPREGIWILCGYGRFGKAIYQEFKGKNDIHLIVIEAFPETTGYPLCEFVAGRGTERDTLQRARIGEAVGIIVGTDDDVNNLAIVMMARELNPHLFVVVRQNVADNQVIFAAIQAQMVMQASQIIANHIRVLLTTPLFTDFVLLAKQQGDSWTSHLINHLRNLVDDTPDLWEISLIKEQAPALEESHYLEEINLECLLRDPRDREHKLAGIPLLLVRGYKKILLPELTTQLKIGDHLLWCGTRTTSYWMAWALRDPFVLAYLVTGTTPPRSYVWRWCQKRLGNHQPSSTHS